MDIMHVPGKQYKNADALLRLPVEGETTTSDALLTMAATQPTDEGPETTNTSGSVTSTQADTVIQIDMAPELHKTIQRALPSDHALGAMYRDILKRIKESTDTPITTRKSFRIDIEAKLLY